MASSLLSRVEAGDAAFDWAEIHSEHGGRTATFWMLVDALRIDGVREAFSPHDAQRAARALGALLPTPKLLDLRARQAEVRVPPVPHQYPGGLGMAERSAIEAHSARVEREVGGRAGVVDNVGKHWVLHAKMSGQRAVLYGWHVPYQQEGAWRGIKVYPAESQVDQFVIQPPSDAHDYDHIDYSMTLMLVRADCVVDGRAMRTADVLRSEELCELAVAGGRPLIDVELRGAGQGPVMGDVAVGGRPSLKRGARGQAVRQVQLMLLAEGFTLGHDGADGVFGGATEAAVRAYQQSRGLAVDGAVGPRVWAALLADAPAIVTPSADIDDPPRPTFSPLVGDEQRARVFGKLDHRAAPRPDDPEAIEILGDWVAKNIVSVEVPQLRLVAGVMLQGRLVGRGPASRVVSCHRLIAEQLLALWAAWERRGLLEHVLTWDGLWAPRFIRGSRSVLSNHAFGTAFDINASFNRHGAVPSFRGERGSVRELVGVANEHGFYWGGHFARRDGMHFEVAQLIK